MHPDNYQRLAALTEAKLHGFMGSKDMRGLHAAVGVVTEAGELADLFKKSVWYGKGPPGPMTATVADEVGDILWYCALACTVYGLRLSDVMKGNIAKLQKRYPDMKFSAEDALARDREAEAGAVKGALEPLDSSDVGEKFMNCEVKE